MLDEKDEGCALCALVTAIVFMASFGVVIWFVGKIFDVMD